MMTIKIEVNEKSHRYHSLMGLLRRENFIYEIQSEAINDRAVCNLEDVRAAAVRHAENIWGKNTEWVSEHNSSVSDFTAGAEWAMKDTKK